MYLDLKESIADTPTTREAGESSTALLVEHEHALSSPNPMTRTHLPTQAELCRSRELIEQWQKELDRVEKTIIEDIIKCLEYDKDNTRRDMAIKGAKDDISGTIDWFLKNTEVDDIINFGPLRRKQAGLINQLENERCFVSPIRKLSTEIFVEIFSYTAGFPVGSFHPDVPNRRLALVCKGWRSILLHSSSLWKTIDVPRIVSRNDPPGTLKRRLKLAHYTRLDVTLSISRDVNELLDILEGVGVEQWRSLVLKVTIFFPRYGQYKTPNGSLSGLRSLIIDNSKSGGSCEGTWTSMLDLVEKTALDLRSFTLSCGGVPRALAQSNVLSNVVSINIPYIPTLPPFSSANTKKDELTSDNDRVSFDLPPMATLRNCNFKDFVHITFSRVTDLTVCFTEEPKNQHPPLEMPELVSLSLKGADVFVCLIDLFAPKLVKLELIDDDFPVNQKTKNKVKTKELRNHGAGATDTFDTNKDRVHIEPVELKLNLVLSWKSLLLVLSSWPQIQRLEFWDPWLRLERSFFKSFCEIKWMEEASRQRVLSKSSSSGTLSLSSKLELPAHVTLICPNLAILQVSKVRQCQGDDRDMKWWREIAEKIMRARVSLGLPLKEIFWMSDSSYDCVKAGDFV